MGAGGKGGDNAAIEIFVRVKPSPKASANFAYDLAETKVRALRAACGAESGQYRMQLPLPVVKSSAAADTWRGCSYGLPSHVLRVGVRGGVWGGGRWTSICRVTRWRGT